MNVKDFGTLRFLSTAIKAVGVYASEIKFRRGYQYQCWQNKTRPATALGLMLPSRVVREIVAFLPQELRIPVERIEPILERISSCLS